jgi:hypothetical protein
LTTPNLFNLMGHHVHVTYTTSGFDGRPHLSYQDQVRSVQFTGDEVESVDTAAGTVTSVRLVTTVDSGWTTFSVLIPRMNVDAGSPDAVHTEGITTIHRYSVVPAFDRGQLDTYSVIRLVGTAAAVDF